MARAVVHVIGNRHHFVRGALAFGWLVLQLWAGEPVSARTLAALIQVQGQPLAGGRVSGSAVVPLERARGGDTPVLTFATDLGPVRLLLDTGATSSMVRPELAVRLGLRAIPLAPGDFRLAGGGADCQSLQPQRLLLPPLRLGGLRLAGMEALMLPVAALPAGVDGVLGVPSLRLLPVAVDPLAQRLSLGPAALRPQPRQTLPLRWFRGVPLVGLITLAGRVEALADTGAEGLFLSPALAARLHPLNHAETLEMVGFCGRQTVRRQTFVGLAFAPPVSPIQGPPALGTPVAQEPRPQEPRAREQAVQGSAALEQPREGIITENPIFKQLGVAAIVGQELLRQRPQLWRLDLKEPRLELW
jgi:predicted aspartyl protease